MYPLASRIPLLSHLEHTVLWGLSLLFPLSAALADPVIASKGHIEIPTYSWSAVKHPYFIGTDKVNIYPYPMLDFLSRNKTNRTYRTVVLENEYLRITFLPELGGKIHEVIDKTTGKPMFYVNHVIKPGLIGQCGAWTSGGVEWNTGPQGHTVGCMQPMDVIILPKEKDGSRSVAIGETERIYGTHWTVVVTLRPGRSFIEERIRIYNPTKTVRPYYFWNCTAAPNTPGFRFIYPMTLGCDHAGEKFFEWPVDHGKDLTRGTNYEDASSIFAWHCDQDFFGSYNDDLDHGAVSYATHNQLPGKKAWTWGQGGFGRMHQRDLTDDDGPYNEVQTGPLLTQAQVGRLDPCEAVEWNEWWYPLHGTGGFTFASKDVAINVERNGAKLRLRMLGTGTWHPVTVRMRTVKGSPEQTTQCGLSPSQPKEAWFNAPEGDAAAEIDVVHRDQTLARFEVPLALPVRTPPTPNPKSDTAAAFAQTGWEQMLFAKYADAEQTFSNAVEKDPKHVSARAGLAFLNQTRNPSEAKAQANAALEANPDDGLARFALAAVSGDAGLEDAWKASLDPVTAAAGRALAAEIFLGERRWAEAEAALSGPGPWSTDSRCRDLRALAQWKLGKDAQRTAHSSLEADPLDTFALAVLWLANSGKAPERLSEMLKGKAEPVLELTARFAGLKQFDLAARVLREFYIAAVAAARRDPMASYWMAFLANCLPDPKPTADEPGSSSVAGIFPHRIEDEAVLRFALQQKPEDTRAALLLGHLLFQLGRYDEGRRLWEQAANAGTEPAVACRALGMAAKTLNNDLASARQWLERANKAEPSEPIVARDLAGVLFALTDKASEEEKQQLTRQARACLQTAFEGGKGRSDFVALLARAQSRVGDHKATAQMLDHVRVTVWEGSHEVHDLFVQAHLALGESSLKEGRPAEALKEFDRALEYPDNLATGKLENAREAHIQYHRGLALAALGRGEEAKAAWKRAADEPKSDNPEIESAQQKARESLEGAH